MKSTARSGLTREAWSEPPDLNSPKKSIPEVEDSEVSYYDEGSEESEYYDEEEVK